MASRCDRLCCSVEAVSSYRTSHEQQLHWIFIPALHKGGKLEGDNGDKYISFCDLKLYNLFRLSKCSNVNREKQCAPKLEIKLQLTTKLPSVSAISYPIERCGNYRMEI